MDHYVQVAENVSLILVFNPGSIRDPVYFSKDQTFHHVTLGLRFRSTLSITELVDCVAEHSGMFISVVISFLQTKILFGNFIFQYNCIKMYPCL